MVISKYIFQINNLLNVPGLVCEHFSESSHRLQEAASVGGLTKIPHERDYLWMVLDHAIVEITPNHEHLTCCLFEEHISNCDPFSRCQNEISLRRIGQC